MSKKYQEYKGLNLPNVAKAVMEKWDTENVFQKSIETREGNPPFVFFEGPPSANGLPGIHHVMARSIKDIFCRYKTLKGFQVKRKAGWDTHGLPVELGVEKELGITKEDIGKTISVDEYNQKCREAVMRYTDIWNKLTKDMGYWVDMDNPYITYESKYMESVWWLLAQLYNKDMMYKGYTIQPYSPKAGTGLSSHELNQPGCYRDVKDRTAIAQFKAKANDILPENTYFLAWTTTPWTLPSNTALAVGKNIDYTLVQTYNPYTFEPCNVVLASATMLSYFKPENHARTQAWDIPPVSGQIPWCPLRNFKGSDLAGISYEQLLPFVQPQGDAFKVIIGDFVTTEDGTGIVHIAPSFGADDFRVAKQNNIEGLTLVDLQGKFVPEVKDDIFLYGSEYVKEAYLTDEEKQAEFEKQKEILEKNGKIKELKNYLSVDERIVLKLQEEGKLFKKETYEHSYPHCWRTDKPILYYPLDSWFIRAQRVRERMLELNNTINWKPEATGSGRFGKWLENVNDWNLSRSRYWGIPIPIWTSEDGTEQIVISSVEELKNECEKAVMAGVMSDNPLADFIVGDLSKENYDKVDLHKNYMDKITLVSPSGKPMKRESDLIDVWFDSGSMPYAQWHYPFENKEIVDGNKGFPADFIAEGVDQTRGWFYTLHAIGTMVFDSVAYKNVVSNGLVLDKNGQKMSKRLGNAVDPFTTLEKYGPDATRWYMIANAAPWDNLKFDVDGIAEVQRKLFGTLYNTYSFYALYANVDSFVVNEQNIVPIADRSELDRWIISKLHSLVAEVSEHYDNYEPHRAARAVEEFVSEHLSNWYIRLSRRRFWRGEMSDDKKSAYETLHECLMIVAQLMSPIAPFFADWLYQNMREPLVDKALKNNTPLAPISVHLTLLTAAETDKIDQNLEERMDLAQRISSMILSIRKKENLRVRQPLQRVQIPVLSAEMAEKIEKIQDLILSEVNIKEIELIDESKAQIVKTLKINFKTLGKTLGTQMKAFQEFVKTNDKEIISAIEKTGKFEWNNLEMTAEDFEIIPVDIPGWKVANSGALTVALDITLTEELKNEGIARELVNRVQNLRKDSGLEVTDKINLAVETSELIQKAIEANKVYIATEILANNIEFKTLADSATPADLVEEGDAKIAIEKLI